MDRNIILPKQLNRAPPVALRKESVDRNNAMQIVIIIVYASLSARRAWIEIVVLCLSCVLLLVALRKESVDRNIREDVS